MEKNGSQSLELDVTRRVPPSDRLEHSSMPPSETPNSEPSPVEVAEALQRILQSASFRTSERGKQFLSFVVRHRLDNPTEPVKERTIGVALFHRSIDYATGDDSVVRAQAREVRRRLEKYYAECANDGPVRIELPVGSYSPEFKWVSPQQTAQPTILSEPSISIVRGGIEPFVVPLSNADRLSRPIRWKLLFGVVAAIVCVLGTVLFVTLNRTGSAKSMISQFWAPALSSSKPFLICLPRPILYRPSDEIYKRTAQFPGEFDREVDRMTHRPHLKPDDAVHWKEMYEFPDYGVSEGDVQAAFRISSFLTHQGKDTEARIGNGYSTADLRNSPAVVIGAFSNPLAIEMTSHLHFAFVDDANGLRIQEQGPAGRSWYTKHGNVGEDYGLLTRLIDSSTGQFVVLVAGVEASGSDAAADLAVNPDQLEKVLRDEPKYWPQKNMQILVSTTVNDYVAGPPKIIAVYVW
jgi:hypothetical protein